MTNEKRADLPSGSSALPKSPGRVAFGYKANDDGTRAPEPREAAIVRELFERAPRESLVKLVREFKMRGLYRRDGQPLTRPSAAAILRNPTYAGHRPEIAPALVDEKTFAAAQKALDRNKRYGEGGSTGAKYLLTGIALCGICGRPLEHQTVMSAGVVKDHYRCYVPGDHTLGRSLTWLDAVVISELMGMLPDAKPGMMLFDLARDSKPRDAWDRLPLTRRRAIIRESLIVEILRVGRGRSNNLEGVRFTRKALPA
jgi:hypothetical protein